jgi:uncharacterized protein (TIGR00369 family)
LKLRAATDGRIVRVEFVFRPEHVGFRQTIHGGLTATVLDELMSWACAVQSKRFGYCAELSVRYLQPVRPNEPLVAVAELTANRRGRLFETKAELRNQGGVVLATAGGKYFPLKQSQAAEFAQDIVGDLEWVIGPIPEGRL